MRFILRIVAFVAMLLAVTDAVWTTTNLVWNMTRPSSARTASDSTDRASAVLPTIERGCAELSGPAGLFCLGAILYVLIRISVEQEQEVRLPPPTQGGSSAARGKP